MKPKPTAIPSTCGMPRRTPTAAPVAVSMTLFGPGVTVVTMEKIVKAMRARGASLGT